MSTCHGLATHKFREGQTVIALSALDLNSNGREELFVTKIFQVVCVEASKRETEGNFDHSTGLRVSKTAGRQHQSEREEVRFRGSLTVNTDFRAKSVLSTDQKINVFCSITSKGAIRLPPKQEIHLFHREWSAKVVPWIFS
jgi:hypothetical protein